MTRAEKLRHVADQAEGTASHIRYSEPWEARVLDRLARELREIASALPPEERA